MKCGREAEKGGVWTERCPSPLLHVGGDNPTTLTHTTTSKQKQKQEQASKYGSGGRA